MCVCVGGCYQFSEQPKAFTVTSLPTGSKVKELWRINAENALWSVTNVIELPPTVVLKMEPYESRCFIKNPRRSSPNEGALPMNGMMSGIKGICMRSCAVVLYSIRVASMVAASSVVIQSLRVNNNDGGFA